MSRKVDIFLGRKAGKNGGEYSKTHGFFPVGARCTVPPLKYNKEPENDGFQKESPFPGADFQVQCLTLGV